MFKERCAELGDPKRSLLVAKLARPTFSCGIFKRITAISTKLTIKENTLKIYIKYLVDKY